MIILQDGRSLSYLQAKTMDDRRTRRQCIDNGTLLQAQETAGVLKLDWMRRSAPTVERPAGGSVWMILSDASQLDA